MVDAYKPTTDVRRNLERATAILGGSQTGTRTYPAVTVVPVALTLVVLFGTMGDLGIDASVVTGIMAGLTIGVGIDYAIHFSATLRRESERGTPRALLSLTLLPTLAGDDTEPGLRGATAGD